MISMDEKLGEPKTGSSVGYSLILRLRGFYILKKIRENSIWSKKEFLKLVEDITGSLDIYKVYLSVKNDKTKDNITNINSADKLIKYLEKEIKKWENMKRKEEKKH